MKIKQIVIYGAGGFGREIAWLVQSCKNRTYSYEVVCFIDDNREKYDKILNGIPVMSLESAYKNFPSAYMVNAIGNPKTRQATIEKSVKIGFPFETIIHPGVERSAWIEIGCGTIICAGNILTTNIQLGEYVQINLDCTIGHDVIMKDYTTLAPGVHVSGYVHLGKRVYVGTGAVFINGTINEPLKIGDDAVIGAGACVTKSVPSGETVVGIPAKIIK
ncbi:Acetyltransferase [Candidatus Magnetomoraceae bacterium gMMP-13]